MNRKTRRENMRKAGKSPVVNGSQEKQPDGPSEQQNVLVGINAELGIAVMKLSRPDKPVALPPSHARALAKLLLQKADEIDRKNAVQPLIIIPGK